MRYVIGWAIFIIGIVASIWVGGWIMFVQPIIEACRHFDAGTLTAMIIGTTILKCIFAGGVGAAIFYLCTLIGVSLTK